jgi:hypothetical protein
MPCGWLQTPAERELEDLRLRHMTKPLALPAFYKSSNPQVRHGVPASWYVLHVLQPQA